MKLRYLLLLPSLACAAPAHAAIYKRVDAAGNVTYSNKRMKGSRRIKLAPLPIIGPKKTHRVSYHHVNNDQHVRRSTQRNRDKARRRILQDELANEQQLLSQARKVLKSAASRPQVTRVGGQPGNGLGGQNDIQNAQAQVDLHRRNIRALKQELSSTR